MGRFHLWPRNLLSVVVRHKISPLPDLPGQDGTIEEGLNGLAAAAGETRVPAEDQNMRSEAEGLIPRSGEG